QVDDVASGERRGDVDELVAPDRSCREEEKEHDEEIAERIDRDAIRRQVIDRAKVANRQRDHKRLGAPPVGSSRRYPAVDAPVLPQADQQDGEKDGEKEHARPAELDVEAEPIVVELTKNDVRPDQDEGKDGTNEP